MPLAAAHPPRPSPVATENAKARKDVMQKTNNGRNFYEDLGGLANTCDDVGLYGEENHSRPSPSLPRIILMIQ